MTPKLRKAMTALAVAEQGTLVAAAGVLGLSQPALSRALQSLETELDAQLFLRGSRGLVPTEEGAQLTLRLRRARTHLRRAGGRSTALLQASDPELEAAIAVAGTGSVSGAARRMRISQPAISRSLRTLEERLGQAVFERRAGEMHLTRPGERLVRHARLAFAEIRQGLEEIRALGGARGGQLRIGALPLTRVRMVPAAVHLTLESYPDAQIAVVDGGFATLYPALMHGEIDMLVGTLRDRPAREAATEHIFDDTMVVVARAGHPLASSGPLTLERCLDYDWVVPFGTVPLRTRFEEILAEAGLPSPGRLVEADSVVVVRALLTSSDRLAVLSRHQVMPELEWGVLSVLPIDLPHQRRPVGVTLRQDYVPTPLAEACLAALRAPGTG